MPAYSDSPSSEDGSKQEGAKSEFRSTTYVLVVLVSVRSQSSKFEVSFRVLHALVSVLPIKI